MCIARLQKSFQLIPPKGSAFLKNQHSKTFTNLRHLSLASAFVLCGEVVFTYMLEVFTSFTRLLFFNKASLAVLLLLHFSFFSNAQVVWQENFSGANQGWSTNFTDCDGAGGSFAGVRNNRFETQGMEGAPCCTNAAGNTNGNGGNFNEWVTNPINIAPYCRVSVSVNYGSTGNNPFECSPGGPHTGVDCSGGMLNGPITQSHDQIVFEYSLDGGPWIQFGYVCGAGAGTMTVNNLVGSTIAIRIMPANKAEQEIYWFDNVTVTAPVPPTVNQPADRIVCAGANVSVPLTGSAGAVFDWTNSNTLIGLGAMGTGNINFTASNAVTAPEVATITVTPRNGTCLGTPVTFMITVNPRPTADDPPNQTVCAGEPVSASLTGSSGATFNWTNSNPAIGLGGSGSGDIMFTSANVASVQVGTITVTPTLNGCPGTPQTFTVTVNPAPILAPIPPLNRCAGQNASVNFGGPAGTTYAWTNDNPNVGLAGSGTGNINFTTTAPNGTPEVANITVTPTLGSCPGPPQNFTITVNPVPMVDPPANLTVCGGDPIGVSFSGNSPSATYNWLNNNPATGVPSSGSGDINATAANVSGTSVSNITVTPTENGCPGTPRTFTVTVNATPVLNPINNITRCVGQSVSVNFSGSGGGVYNWTNDNPSVGLGASGTGNINFTAQAPNGGVETANITVTPVNGNCIGQPQTFTITVNPAPLLDPIPNQTVCGGDPIDVSFNVSSPSATINWTNNNPQTGIPGSGSGNINTSAANVTTVQVSTITATPTENGCPGTPRTFAVTVQPTPVLNQLPPIIRCSGQSVTANVTGTAGATLTWTNDNPAIGLGASGNGGNFNFTGQTPNGVSETGNITVTPVFGNCPGQPMTFSITINPTPMMDPPASLTVCAEDPINVSFTGNSPGITYNWTNNNAGTGIPSSGSGDINTTAANVPTSRTSNITVTPVENGCSGTPRNFSVTVLPKPVVNPINDITRCVGQAVSVTFSGNGGGVYNWTNDNPAIGLAGSGVGNINFTGTAPNGGPETATITVTPVNGICVGQPQTFTITINPVPSLAPIPSQTVCGGDPINVNFNGSTPGTIITWTNNNTSTGIPGSGSGDINETAANVTTVRVSTIVATPSEFACNGTPQTFAVTVQPTPVVNPIADLSRCVGQAVSVTFSGTGGAVYTWSNDNPAIGLPAGGTSNTLNFTGQAPNGIPETGTITVTPRFSNCIGEPITFNITINPVPTVDPIPNQTVCAGEPINVTFSGSSAGATYTWTNNNPGTGIPFGGTGDINEVASPVPAVRVSTITVTPMEFGCSGTPRTFTVTVQPLPVINLVDDVTRCAGQAITVNLSGTPGTTFNWVNDNTEIGLPASGTGNLSFTGKAPSGILEIATITVSPVNGNCFGQDRTFQIAINPLPLLDPIPNLTVCGGDPIAVSFSGSSPTLTFNWTNGNTTTGVPGSGSGNIMAVAANVTTVRTSNISVTANEAGCNSLLRTFNLTVQPTPVVDALPDVAKCVGEQVSIPFAGTAGALYNWTNSNTDIGLAASGNGATLNFTARNTGTTPLTATITVTPRLGTCTGDPLSFQIIIHPRPAASAVPNVSVCGGEEINIAFAGSSPTATYNWTNTNTATGIAATGTGNIAVTTTPNSTLQVSTVSVTPVENGCNGTPVLFTATVQPIPVLSPIPNVTQCAGQAIAVTFNGTNGSQYAWTNSNPNIGLGVSGTGSGLNFTGNAASTGAQTATITVSPTLGTCAGAPQSFNILVNSLPSLNPIPNQTVCGGETIAVNFGSSSATTTYTWSNNNSATGIAASGSGNIAVTTTASPTLQTGVVTVTPMDNGCAGTPLSFTATVQPVPVLNPVPNVTKCAGEAIAVTFNGTGGSQYTWTNSNTSIGLGASGTGGSLNFTGNANGNNGQTATITVNPTLGTCAGAPQSFNILVNTLPSLDPVPNQTVCGGAPIVVNFGGSSTTSTYNWVNNNPATGIAATGSGNISITTTASQTAQSGTVTVTPVDNGCVGTPLSFTATVQPVPVLDPVPNVTKCAGEPIAVTFNATSGTQYTWTNSNPSIGLGASGTTAGLSFTGVATGVGGQTATISVNPTLGTCAGAPQTFNILVNPLPSLSPIPNQTVCGGESITVNFGGSSASSTYNWTNSNPATGISASGSGNIAVTTTASPTLQAGTVTVTPTDNGCAGAPLTFTATVQPVPVLNPVPNVTKCAGEVIDVTFSGTTGTQYAWTNSNTGIGLNASGSGAGLSFTGQTSAGVSQSAVITVSPTLGTCPGTPQSFNVSIGQLPTVNVVPDLVLCGNQPISIAFTGNLPASTYGWTNNNTATGVPVFGTGDISLNAAAVTAPQTSTIVVTPNENGCNGQPMTFKVTVNPVPAISPISDVTRCAGLPIAVTFNGPAGTQYAWTNNNTNIGLAANGSTASVNFNSLAPGLTPETATISIAPTLGGCLGATQTFNVTVNPVPTANAVGAQTVCGGQPIAVTFDGSLPTATYNWTNSNSLTGISSSGSGNISITTPQTQTTQTGTITVTPTAFGCTGTPQTFTTTVSAVPVMNPLPDVSKCVGENVAVTFVSTPGTQYNWTNSNVLIGLPGSGTSGNLNFTTQSPSGAAQSATVVVTPSLGVCPGTPQTFDINIGQQPTVNAVPNQTLCAGQSISVSFSGVIPTATYNWTNNNTATGLPASGTGTIAQISSAVNTPAVSTLTVVPNDNGCNGLPINFTVTVNPTPSVMAPANENHCVGESIAVNFNGTAGAQYDWVNSNPNIGLPASGSGPGISFVSQTPGGVAQSAMITLTPTLNGCVGASQSFQINLGQVPTVNAVPNVALCGGESINVNFSGISPTSTYTWSNNNTATGIAANGTGNITVATTPSQVAQIGTVVVTPTDNGCQGAPINFLVTVQPVPIMVKPADLTRCAGAPILVNFAGTGGAQFNWSNNNTNIGLGASGTNNSLNFNGLAPGGAIQTATITTTPVLGACFGQSQSFNVVINPVPSVNMPGNQTVCGGDTIAVAFGGSSPTATYNWTNSNTAIGLAASGSGSVLIPSSPSPTLQVGTIQVTPVENGCSGTPQSFTATVQPVPVMNDPADVGKCRGEAIAVNFTGTAGAQYSWTNSNPNIGLPASGTGNALNFNGQIVGGVNQTALITVTPSLGTCPGIPQTFNIAISPTPSVNPVSGLTLCGNEPIVVSFGGSSGTTVYNWTNNNTATGIAASGMGNISVLGASTTSNQSSTITVTPVDGGCSGTPETFQVNINAISSVNPIPDQASCGNQVVNIPVTGSSTNITWTNSNPAVGLAASGSGNITFTATNVPQTSLITLTPTGACPGPVQTFNFTIVSAPTVNNPGPQAVCAGAPLELVFDGTASATYAWTNSNTAIGVPASGSGNISATAPPVSQTQTASFTVTPQINGCLGAPVTFNVGINPLPIASINGVNRICEGQNAMLTATGGTTYQWGTGETTTTLSVTPLSSTSYTVTATDANGCTDDATFALRVNKHSAFTLLKTSCNLADTGTVVQKLSNFLGCDSILTTVTRYLDKDTTLLSRVTCIPTQAGVQEKKLINFRGCDSLIITTILYDPAGRDTVRLSRQSCNPAQAGVSQNLLTGADGCDSLIITTTLYAPLDTMKVMAVSCNPDLIGKTLRRYDNFKGCDSLVLTTTLFNPNGRDTTLLNRNVCDPASVGVSQSLLKNKAGCDSLVIVTSILRPELCGMTSGVSVKPASCAERADGAASLVLTEGIPPFQYRWSAAKGLTGNGQITALNVPLQIPDLPAGTFSVTISIPNTNIDTVITLNIAGPPVLAVKATATMAAAPFNLACAGNTNGSLDVSTNGGTAPYQYRWNNGATTASLSGLGAGQYNLTVTDRNGCTVQVSSALTAPPALRLVLDVEKPACFATVAEGAISATGGVKPYTLLLNDKPIQGAFAKFAGGLNRIALKDKNGCAVDSSITVTVPTRPTISLPRDTLVLLGESLTLTPSTNLIAWDTVIWKPLPDSSCAGCLGQTWFPTNSRRYDVTIIDTFGCKASASTLVRVDRDIDIFVPNIFSPNNDGTHDVLTIGVSKYLETATLDIFRVYDRWGDQAYDWDQPVPIRQWPGWDGKFGGRRDVMPGVYVWYLKVKLANGEVIEKAGDVTVYR